MYHDPLLDVNILVYSSKVELDYSRPCRVSCKRNMLTIKEIKIPGFEKVVEANDPARGLHCFVAIHSTALGPALGGVRIHLYQTPKEALNDVLRLAEAMTYKSALAENGLGGGKSVIIADPSTAKTSELLHAFAEVVNTFQGTYIAAEDLGATIADLEVIGERTPYVAALASDKSSGDPSRFTARGIYRGIQAVCKKLWNTESVKNKKIAISGLGNVGSKLADILFWEGADLIVTDLKEKTIEQHVHDYGAMPIGREEIFSVECDIFSPCAFGGILNPATIPLLKCKAVAGSANNQLQAKELGADLMKRGILYAPDYIINSGGIINAAAEFEPNGYDSKCAREKVNHIYDILMKLFDRSVVEGVPTNAIADQIAEYNLRHFVGKRKHKITFH